MTIRSHRDLKVWRRAIDLVDRVYDATAGYPRDERYGLVSQTQRAAVSICANIAEGFARGPLPDYLRFLSIASGSCAELDTHLVIATRRRYISAGTAADLVSLLDEVGRMLNGLRASLRRRRDLGPRP